MHGAQTNLQIPAGVTAIAVLAFGASGGNSTGGGNGGGGGGFGQYGSGAGGGQIVISW